MVKSRIEEEDVKDDNVSEYNDNDVINQVMPLMCTRCRNNFCLRHRHEMDHECKDFENTGRAMSSQG